MKAKKTSKIRLSIIFAVIICSLCSSLPAFASVDNTIVDRAIVGSLRQCYISGKMKASIDLATFELSNGGNTLTINDNDPYVHLPNGTVNGDNDFSSGTSDALTCAELLKGKGSFTGVLSRLGISTNIGAGDDNEVKMEALEALGYTPSSYNTENCVKFRFTKDSFSSIDQTRPNSYDTQQICATVNSSGNITVDHFSPLKNQHSENNEIMNFMLNGSPGQIGITVYDDQYGVLSSSVTFTKGESWNSVLTKLDNAISQLASDHGGLFWKDALDNSGSRVAYTFSGHQPPSQAATYPSTYKLVDTAAAWGNVLGDNLYTLTDSQRRTLYEYYLSRFGDFSCKAGDLRTKITLKIGGKDEVMYVKANTSINPDTFYIPNSENKWELNSTSFSNIISEMDGKTTSGGYIKSCSETRYEEYEKDDDSVCFDNAGALGWIICPLFTATSNALNGIYTYVESNFLRTEVGTAFNDEVRNVWGYVRDVANVVFVIMLLVIIFSQITGYGIDNYGIKRMLPRLIVVAVLVNLSLIICQLLVDVSNIAGNGIGGLLDTMSTETSILVPSGNATAVGVFEAIGAGAILGILAASGVLSIGAIVTILLAIVSAIIAFIFLWIILIARQAAIIVAIILAPAAMVCYMLPNTEKYFKSWRRLIVMLLLVYPICSLAVGAGKLLSGVFANVGAGQNNSMMVITAMVVRVLPFFLIPTFLRRSMQGLGNLSGVISGIGQRVSRGAQGAARAGIQRTGLYQNAANAYKDREEFRNKNRETERAQRIVDRLRARQDSGKSLSRRQAETLARYQQRVLSANQEAEDIRRLSSRDYVEARTAQIESDARESAIGTNLERIKNSDWFMSEDFNTHPGGKMYDNVTRILNNGTDEERAAMTRAMSMNDHTRDVLRSALTDFTADNMSDAGKQKATAAVAQEIKSDGRWKGEYDRRMSDWATTDNGSQSLANFDYGTNGAKLSEKLTQDYMVKSDDNAMASMQASARAIKDRITDGTATDEDRKVLERYQSEAYKTLHSDAANGLKVERKEALQDIAGNYRPEEVLNIEHEQAAQNRGKVNTTFNYRDASGTMVTGHSAEIYAAPESFSSPVGPNQRSVSGYTRHANGDYIYTRQIINRSDGKVVKTQKWNATTGKYMRD